MSRQAYSTRATDPKNSLDSDPKEVQRTLERLAGQLSEVAAHIAISGANNCSANTQTPENIRLWLRQSIRIRRLRDNFLPKQLFADPAWDMLLDLTLAKLEGRCTSVSSLCIAAAVPTTTALRWIKQLMEAGMLVRRPDPEDRRRHYIEISEVTFELMGAFIQSAGAASSAAVVERGQRPRTSHNTQ